MSDGAQATIAGVRADTLAEVADELYALPPAEFIAARDERARAARTAGRREDAAAIRKLARPTTSAWLVNQLGRDSPAELARLFEVAEALQEAQRTLAGDRLRELSARRRKVVTELIPVAAAVAREAGQPASQPVLDEVRATLEAALADPDAREAVRSGRLTRALAYAGLGEIDLSAAAALTAAGPGRRGAPAAGSRPGRAGHGVAERDREAPGLAAADPAARAAAAVAAAQSAAASAAEAVTAAEREQSAIVEQRQFLRRRISHLEGELAQTREEDARLAADAQRAERTHDTATRDLRAAERRLEQARREQAKLGDPG
jgi:hypothetical protein